MVPNNGQFSIPQTTSEENISKWVHFSHGPLHPAMTIPYPIAPTMIPTHYHRALYYNHFDYVATNYPQSSPPQISSNIPLPQECRNESIATLRRRAQEQKL